MGNFRDLTGQKFGELTVLYRGKNSKNGRVVWHCKCSCGNECDVQANNLISGSTRSCGCKTKNRMAKLNYKDLTGKKFGRLLVLYRSENQKNNSHAYWHCRCDCGNEKDVRGSCLISGEISSCGCLMKEQLSKRSQKNLKDIRFGKLIALYPTEKRTKSGGMIWHCKCDCGNECDVAAHDLLKGSTQSCGCLKISHGELKIKTILNENQINYETEKTFNDCRFINTKLLARYDFYLPKEKILIEFDGRQHFIPNAFLGGEEEFKIRQEHDRYKNQYALEHGYILIRIPYFDEDKINIDMLLGKNHNYIVTSVD